MPETEAISPRSFDKHTGVIILLDSLGTKGILASRSPQMIIEDWRYIVELFEKATKDAANAAGAACTHWDVRTFSDTIMITLAGPIQDGLLQSELIMAAGEAIFIPFYMSLLRGVFLRGAIAAGLYYQHDAKVIGPAIDEAAAWYETSDWIGIAATPTFGHYLDLLEQHGVDLSYSFMHHQVPTKQGLVRKWVFAWPRIAAAQGFDIRVRALEAFAKHAGSVGVEVASKYRHTLDFVNLIVQP